MNLIINIIKYTIITIATIIGVLSFILIFGMYHTYNIPFAYLSLGCAAIALFMLNVEPKHRKRTK